MPQAFKVPQSSAKIQEALVVHKFKSVMHIYKTIISKGEIQAENNFKIPVLWNRTGLKGAYTSIQIIDEHSKMKQLPFKS